MEEQPGDAALPLNVTAGSWTHVTCNRIRPPTDFLAARDGGVAGLRVACGRPTSVSRLSIQRCANSRNGRRRRFEELGAHVEEAGPGLPDPWDIEDTIWSAAQATMHMNDFERVRDQIDPGRIPIIEHGLTLRATDLARAHARRNDYAEAMRVFMQRYDLLLTPTPPITGVPGRRATRRRHQRAPDESPLAGAFTYPFNLTGKPAVSCRLADRRRPAGRPADVGRAEEQRCCAPQPRSRNLRRGRRGRGRGSKRWKPPAPPLPRGEGSRHDQVDFSTPPLLAGEGAGGEVAPLLPNTPPRPTTTPAPGCAPRRVRRRWL